MHQRRFFLCKHWINSLCLSFSICINYLKSRKERVSLAGRCELLQTSSRGAQSCTNKWSHCCCLLAAEESKWAASGLPGCWPSWLLAQLPTSPQPQKPQDKPPSLPARLLTCVFLQQINLPLYLHHPHVPITCQSVRDGAWPGYRQTHSSVRSSRAIANREVLSKPPPPGKSIPASQFNYDERAIWLSRKSHAARFGACPLRAHAALQPGSCSGRGQSRRDSGGRGAGEGSGSGRATGGLRDRRAGRLPRQSPGAVPLPPPPGTCQSIALTKTALAQAPAKFSHRPVGPVPCPIPAHAPPGAGSALLTALRMGRRRESKDKGTESSREGRLGNALRQDRGQERVSRVGFHAWQDWPGGRKEVTSSHTRELTASKG